MKDSIDREVWRNALRKDPRIQAEFTVLAHVLLGASLEKSLGSDGSRAAEDEVLDLIANIHPTLPSADRPAEADEKNRMRLRQFFVIGLYRAARARVSLPSAIREGFAVSARSLALQLAAHTLNPMDWAKTLEDLRLGKRDKRIVGEFPALDADGFSLALVTVLADQIRLEFVDQRHTEVDLARGH